MNQSGKVIHRANVNTREKALLEIDLQQLPIGVYYLKVITDYEVYHHKIIKR